MIRRLVVLGQEHESLPLPSLWESSLCKAGIVYIQKHIGSCPYCHLQRHVEDVVHLRCLVVPDSIRSKYLVSADQGDVFVLLLHLIGEGLLFRKQGAHDLFELIGASGLLS